MELQESDAKTEQRAYARFYKRAVEDKVETRKAGRPVCVVRDFIEIVTPGDKTNIVDRPMRDEDKRRFPKQFAAFQLDKSQDEASGTPLSAWGALAEERVEMYRFYKVMTVEQLAALGDAVLSNFDAQARKDSQKAEAFLAASKSAAPMLQMQSALDERDKEIAALRQALKDQGDRLDLVGAPSAATDAAKKRRTTKKTDQLEG